MSANKTILLTGANGFIGTALCSALLRYGCRLKCVVRRPWNGPKYLDRGRCEICVVNDKGPDTEWGEVLEGVYAVVHLAGRVHIMLETAKDPLVAFRRVNVDGTLNLAKAAAMAEVKRFVFVSTIKVLGEATVDSPFDERTQAAPVDDYAISKYEAEIGLKKVSAATGMETVIVRPPLVYGPGVKVNFLRLLKWVQRGIPLPFSGVVNQRSFVYVENLADALIRCIECSQAAGETFLISDGEVISTPDLIRRIAMAMGRPARLVPCAEWLLKMAAMMTGKQETLSRLCGSLVVDSSKASRLLDWQPPFSLNEGVQDTVDWYLKEGVIRG